MGRPTNELFREIVSLGSQAVLVVDVSKPHFRIAYANRAYEALSGFPAEALEGTPWLESAAMDESAAEFVRLTEIATAREPGALRQGPPTRPVTLSPLSRRSRASSEPMP